MPTRRTTASCSRARGCSLAPLYDLMCAATWENVTRNLSQTIAGKDRGDYVMGRHWQRMADECGFNRTMILQRVEALAEKARRNIPRRSSRSGPCPAATTRCWATSPPRSRPRCRAVVRNLAHVEDIGEEAVKMPGGPEGGTWKRPPRLLAAAPFRPKLEAGDEGD